MKYSQEKNVTAIYTEMVGNPFLEAMPELIGKKEFETQMKSEICFLGERKNEGPEERRNMLPMIAAWFQPMDYMYYLYDMLYRAIQTTYQTKNIVESILHLNEIHMDFRTGKERKVSYATQAYSGAVLGVPGIGKTSAIQRCLNLMPQVICHCEYQGKPYYTKQINYLIVECPSDCSVKTLAFNILTGIDRAIGSDYISEGNALRAVSTSAITAKLKIICMNHHIGLIVIDEIQNAVLTAARNRQTKPLVKFLVELTNETSTSICFCGTLDAEELFLKQEHLKRRTRGLRLLPLKYDVTYRRFLTELWKFQGTLEKTELTEKLMKQIYDLSGGIPAYIVKIFQEAQVQAILTGEERLSYEMIKKAVFYLAIDVPKNYSRGGTSISDFSLQDSFLEEMVDENQIPAIEAQGNTKEENIITENNQETHPMKHVGRFYATRRGRRPKDRDESDILMIWKEHETMEYLQKKLEAYQMMERRCV